MPTLKIVTQITNLESGTYTVDVDIRDDAGTVLASATNTVTVQGSKPVVDPPVITIS
jgi:hypothetical protein